MNTIVNITDFRNNIGTYIDMIFYNKESYLLKKGKTVVARIAAYEEEKSKENAKEGLKKLAGLWEDMDFKKYNNILGKIEKKDRKDMAKLVSFSKS